MARLTVISQLTSVGENALEQLATSPVARRALDVAVQVKDRVEKVVATLGDIDGRVTGLEKRVEALEKAKRASTRTASSTKPRSTARTTRSKSA